jgi:hypothetical protein
MKATPFKALDSTPYSHQNGIELVALNEHLIKGAKSLSTLPKRSLDQD